MEKSSKISILILAVSVIAAIALTAAAPKSPYTAQLASLQNKLAKANSNTSTLIDKSDSSSSINSSTTSVLQKTTLSIAKSKADDLMKNLYTWSSGSEYTKNKNTIISSLVTSPNVINNVMPDDKDNSGNSQVDALGIHSSLKSVTTYATSLDSNDLYISANATATKGSDVNSDNSPLSNNHVYKVHFDTASQRFDNITYVGKESLNNSTGN